ncbi:MAG: hypothetical protein ACP5NP_11900 [Acetobacteraceae bacterium]
MRLRDVRNWLGLGAEAPAPGIAALPMPAPQQAPARAPPPPSALWSPERLALAGQLWDDGFIGPGGAEEVLHRASPFGLSAASSLLLLGVGAGGPARCVASLLGAWVDGFETDPALVAHAGAVCHAAGLGKRVRVESWDPLAPAFRPAACHHALAFDPFRAADPGPVLDALARGLRPGGQLALLALAATGAGEDAGQDLPAWQRLEGRRGPPPTAEAIGRALAGRGFDVRVSEDLSVPHTQQIVGAWRGWVRAIDATGERPGPAMARVIVTEAELWLRRARLLRGGALRWMRWHAILKR